jgi:hypothetical protein
VGILAFFSLHVPVLSCVLHFRILVFSTPLEGAKGKGMIGGTFYFTFAHAHSNGLFGEYLSIALGGWIASPFGAEKWIRMGG